MEINQTSIKEKINSISDGITTNMYSQFALSEWWPILAKECQVYVCNEAYLAKRFDQINFQFCSKDRAKEILIDNLYALLRFKYFPKTTDATQDKIEKIIKSFTSNLKTVLIRVAFERDTENEFVEFLPDGCIAFRNGVYDFRTNDWLFKYNKIDMLKQKNIIYLYDTHYIVTWYININFSPLDININETTLNEFMDLIKLVDKEKKNYCWELMYNMSHDSDHIFNQNRFNHLCEILGFLCLQSFSQNFVILVGSGQNGKNSLIDGCFTSRVVPSPANIDMKSLENDKFITGALENKAHNIFLETEAETLIQSKMLKALTGSMYQTIEHKGEDRYSSILATKHMWAANEQEKLKFSDTTVGFRRRINIFEIWFRWDAKNRYLAKSDYYNTSFSEDLSELKGDINNIIIFIYFAMYGIKLGTNDYSRSFKFTENDWTYRYTDIDFDLKEAVENITQEKLIDWYKVVKHREAGRTFMYDLNKQALHLSDTIKEYGITNYDQFINKFISDEDGSDLFTQYFAEHDVYMNIRIIQELAGDLTTAKSFTQELKKTFGINRVASLFANKPYIRVTFRNNRLKIVV